MTALEKASMNKIPEEHKAFIRSSYVNYLVLTRLRSELSKFASIGQWCLWGGIVLLGVWLFHQFFKPFSYGISPAACILMSIIGAFIRSESSPKCTRYFEEERRIESEMREIGVIFCGLSNNISVYYQEITNETQFNPLSDHVYSGQAHGAE